MKTENSYIDDDKNIQKFLQIGLLYFLPHWAVFKDFAYFLRTANLRYNSSLVRTIFITLRVFVFNLIFIGVILGRGLGGNIYAESFYKTEEVINKGSTS